MKKLIISLMRSRKIFGFRDSLLLAGMIFFLLSGCSRYQYIAIAGDTHQDKTNNYVIQNDTAKIVYSFKGYNLPVTVEVYNKLNKPLYVDWTKSALIIDGQTFSYWQNKAQLSGTTGGSLIKLAAGVSYYWGDIDGTIIKQKKVSFIPPQSYVKTTRFYLKSRFFETQNHASETTEDFNSANGQNYGTKFTFDKQNSPLRFKSFITLSTNKDFSTEFHFSNAFWVNNIMQTGAAPKSVQHNGFPKTYIRKSTTGGLIFGTILTLGILAAVLALAK